MNFLPNDTLAGYARTAVDLRARMVDYHRSPLAAQYLQAFFGSRLADRPSPSPSPAGMAKVLDALLPLPPTRGDSASRMSSPPR